LVVVGVGEVDDRGRWGSAGGVVDAPAFEARAFKALARAILVDESILILQTKEQRSKPPQVKHKASDTPESTEYQSHH